jgi:hypothetical protein
VLVEVRQLGIALEEEGAGLELSVVGYWHR